MNQGEAPLVAGRVFRSLLRRARQRNGFAVLH
jgi:hypothetical protein